MLKTRVTSNANGPRLQGEQVFHLSVGEYSGRDPVMASPVVSSIVTFMRRVLTGPAKNKVEESQRSPIPSVVTLSVTCYACSIQ